MRNMASHEFVESAEQLIGEIKDHAKSRVMPFGFKLGIAIETFKEIQDMITEEILAAEAALNHMMEDEELSNNELDDLNSAN